MHSLQYTEGNYTEHAPVRIRCVCCFCMISAAWVSSIAAGLRVLTGWTASVVIDAFGVRPTVIVASVTYSLGMLTASFSTSLYQLYLSRGVVVGLSAGFLYTAPVHCLALTFDRRISIGTGLAFVGAGIGVIVNGYAGKEIIEIADWRWYYRMVSGVSLLGIVAAFFLFIDPSKSVEHHASSNADTPAKLNGTGIGTTALRTLRHGFVELGRSVRKGLVLYRDVNFLFMLVAYLFFSLGYMFPVVAAVSTSNHRHTTTVNIQNFGAAKFRHFTIFDISAAIYFRRGVEGMV